MKIYQINVVCGYGSTGRIVMDLHNAIIENGGCCRIAYGRGTAPDNVNAIRISNKLDLYVHAAMTRLTDKHGLFSKTSTKRLIKDIQQSKPDIIHLHNIHGYYLNYKLLFDFLKKYGKPVVWTMHDCWAFTGHCAHFSYIECRKWQDNCYDCQLLNTYPETVGRGNVEKNFFLKKECFTGLKELYIVTPSTWLKEQIEHSFLNMYKTMTINNGIDLTAFQQRIPNQTEKKRILGVASIWNKEKGLDDVFALRKLLPEDYEIYLIGLNRVQLKNLPEGIEGIMRTESIEELSSFYSSADVFINFTYADTFPTVNIEALACGTPILSYNTGGSPEIVGDCGWIIPKGDIKQAADILLKYEYNALLRKRCLERACMYKKEACYRKYLELYEEIGPQ